MNDYDLKLFKEEDYELIETFLTLEDDGHIDLEIQDLDGNPMLEKNGDKVMVEIEKDELEKFIKIMKEESISFNQVIINALTAAIEFEDFSEKSNN